MTATTRESTPVAIEGDGVEIRLQEAGDMTLAFIHLPAGTDMGPALKGLPVTPYEYADWVYDARSGGYERKAPTR